MTHALKRILYVEDEPDIQAVARIALVHVGGFELEICASGQEALERAAPFQPDLLLLDVMMPGMDGVTTLHELRKQPGLETVPAMFMTAKVQPAEVAQLRQQGAIDVIPKPFDPMTLSENIRSLWQKHFA
ncbi:MAG: response regulator [Gammaproteobacteria bacterium]|jgi:two-component system, OmpR family, response regulator